MDIAEIRKKAKAKAGTAAGTQPPAAPDAATTAEAAPPESARPAPGNGAAAGPPQAEPPVAVAGASGIDRLFSGAERVELATEDAYQSTLASRDTLEESCYTQYLSFQLGPEEYALDITRISEIIKPREYTDIPRVPDFILGLVSLRGIVVPVFDLRRRFRLGETLVTPASARVVVCRDGETTAGLLVDSINQVIRMAADRIEPPPPVLSGIDRNLVEGVGRFQGRMIILLNLTSVLNVEMS